MKFFNYVIAAAALSLTSAVPLTAQAASQSAKLIVATPLYLLPERTAATVTNLNVNDPVTINDRQGGWYNVNAASGSGWVRIVTVRFDGVPQLKPDAAIAPSANHNAGSFTVATGIRGLSEQELESAKPDHAALAQVQEFQLTAVEVAQFARDGGLEPGRLEPVGLKSSGVEPKP